MIAFWLKMLIKPLLFLVGMVMGVIVFVRGVVIVADLIMAVFGLDSE